MRNAALFFALFALMIPVHAAPATGQTPPLHWVFQTRHDAQTNPHTTVFLRVGSRQVLVMRQADDEFQIAAKFEYKDTGVPTEALTACLGWWGGEGDYLYVDPPGPLADCVPQRSERRRAGSAVEAPQSDSAALRQRQQS